jgi:hypothetical protein
VGRYFEKPGFFPNPVADALSRIPTDETDKSKKVNAITRSMTRNNNLVEPWRGKSADFTIRNKKILKLFY